MIRAIIKILFGIILAGISIAIGFAGIGLVIFTISCFIAFIQMMI